MTHKYKKTPGFVKSYLEKNAELLGIPVEDVANYHILHSLAIIDAGINLCGEPLLNPMLKTSNWNQLYHHIRTSYERLFVSSRLIKERRESKDEEKT
jgi:hypothetical protein